MSLSPVTEETKRYARLIAGLEPHSSLTFTPGRIVRQHQVKVPNCDQAALRAVFSTWPPAEWHVVARRMGGPDILVELTKTEDC